jgi:hypothetical protein
VSQLKVEVSKPRQGIPAGFFIVHNWCANAFSRPKSFVAPSQQMHHAGLFYWASKVKKRLASVSIVVNFLKMEVGSGF